MNELNYLQRKKIEITRQKERNDKSKIDIAFVYSK